MPQVTGKRRKVYLGLDPGSSGGIAILGEDGALLRSTPMPTTERDLWCFLRDAVQCSEPFATVEKVGGYMPGSAGNIGSAMFKFGQNFGMLKAFLCALSVPYEEVTPAVWQKALGVPPRKKTDTKAQHKTKLKSVAQNLFPEEKVTLMTCDALLLAEYCLRKREGKLCRK